MIIWLSPDCPLVTFLGCEIESGHRAKIPDDLLKFVVVGTGFEPVTLCL